MTEQSCVCRRRCPRRSLWDQSLPAAKPIRIIQFLLVTTVVAVTAYTIFRESPYEKIEEVLLMALYASFLFITTVDMISQLSGEPIPDTPMFLFGLVGMILFLMAALSNFFVMSRTGVNKMWRLTIIMVLSCVCSVLYLLDILLIYIYGY